MLAPPAYIREAALEGLPADYRWDRSYTVKSLTKLEDLVQKISTRGQIALGAVVAEWVVWRLTGLGETRPLLLRVESLFAMSADYRYAVEKPNNPYLGRKGPIDEPLHDTFRELNKMANHMHAFWTSVAQEVALTCHLVRQILPRPQPFDKWFKQAAKTLGQIYPNETYGEVDDDSEEAPEVERSRALGVPVPRQALDPSSKYEPRQGPALIREFLSSLDYKTNPYLSSPEQMKARGFEGVPYTYDEGR